MTKPKKIPVMVYLPESQFDKLEKLRGYEKRATYVQRHLEDVINSEYARRGL